LINDLPHRLLARGAALAQAWPRALLHIESHIREQLIAANPVSPLTHFVVSPLIRF
jgi:hypothetical protein